MVTCVCNLKLKQQHHVLEGEKWAKRDGVVATIRLRTQVSPLIRECAGSRYAFALVGNGLDRPQHVMKGATIPAQVLMFPYGRQTLQLLNAHMDAVATLSMIVCTLIIVDRLHLYNKFQPPVLSQTVIDQLL